MPAWKRWLSGEASTSKPNAGSRLLTGPVRNGSNAIDTAWLGSGSQRAGGGMEYPMITIIGNCSEREELDNVIAHEVGHNWFYGILGSNERDHAWMDEGMNSFVELRYMRKQYANSKMDLGIPVVGKIFDGVTDGQRVDHP